MPTGVPYETQTITFCSKNACRSFFRRTAGGAPSTSFQRRIPSATTHTQTIAFCSSIGYRFRFGDGRWRTVNVLPDLHFGDVQRRANERGREVAAAPPQCGDGTWACRHTAAR